MTPIDFSITTALTYGVWWLNGALPVLGVLIGVPVGSTILVWMLRELGERLP